jgi:hypothetical protein
MVLGGLFVVGHWSAQAGTGASVPYVPSVQARHHLARLADEGGLALVTTQWPLPARAVREALDQLPGPLRPSLEEARQAVRRELERLARADATFDLRRRREALVGFGDSHTPGSNVAVRSAVLEPGDPGPPRFAARLGLRVEEGGDWPPSTQVRLDDTAVVLKAAGVNLQAFSRSHWWGPGWQSSLVLGNNAPAWMGVGLQRSGTAVSSPRWLSWLGPWNADFFLAKARDSEVVAGQPVGYLMNGARISFKPHRLLEIGLTRTLQLEGRGRPGGIRNFLRAWMGRGTNADTDGERLLDPGNQMGGYDLRLSGGAALPGAVYLQLIGEDEAGRLPSKLLLLAGAEGWTADGEHRFFVEYADTHCSVASGPEPGCAYRNGQYPQGYTNGARWAGASQGPDSRVLSVGWLSLGGERLLRMHYGRVGMSLGTHVPSAETPPRGRLWSFAAQQTLTISDVRLTPRASWMRLGDSGQPGGRRVLMQWGVSASWALP